MITLEQVLAAREDRAALQKRLLREYQLPLICFTMNIAGPVKNSDLIREGFLLGHTMLLAQLQTLPVRHWEHHLLDTGCEGYYLVDADALTVKRLTAQIEDSMPVARLFDMDVLDVTGKKLDREQLGLSARRCLLCDNPVYVCSSRRAHTVEQLQQETTRLLQDAVRQKTARQIGALAARSLLQEVCTTPKPGLVDCANSGSHRDMDLLTFLSSTTALQPYFTDCVRIGLETTHLPATEVFRKLRFPGKLAEVSMLEATGGANTHKGAIFSLGVLCAAAGRLPPQQRTPERICSECRHMLAGLTQSELAGLTPETARTTGEKLYIQHGISGIRGQAEQGFPAVLETGLPTFARGLAQGLSWNEAGRAALLHLFCADADTTFIRRSDLQAYQSEATKLSQLLAAHPYPSIDTLQQLDTDWTRRNLSAGGSADLLAITYFLYTFRKMVDPCTLTF